MFVFLSLAFTFPFHVFEITTLIALQILHVRYVNRTSVNEYILYIKNDIKRRTKTRVQPVLIDETIEGLAMLSSKDKLKVKRAISIDSNVGEIAALVNMQKRRAWEWIGPLESYKR